MRYVILSFALLAACAADALASCNKFGAYVASSGHEIKRPRCADDRSGARYICRDGSFSFSEHLTGACSGHGGVERATGK